MKKLLLLIGSIILHLLAIAAIGYLVWPVLRWYFNRIPVRGIDIYNSATYVSYLIRHFATIISGWKYIWYEGSPLGADYPFLHFYFIVPLAKYFGLIRGIQIYAISSFFTLLISSYFLFYELSRNRVVSVVLSIAVAYTLNTFRALIWAGSIPYFSNQMFLPVCLLLLVKYLKTMKKSWLYTLSLIAGLGMMGHSQPFVTAVFPVCILVTLLWVGVKGKYRFFQKIKDLIILGLFSLLVALPGIHNLILFGIRTLWAYALGFLGRSPVGAGAGGPGSLAKSLGSYGLGSALVEAGEVIAEQAHLRYLLTFSDTTLLIWGMVGGSLLLFVLSLIIAKKRLRKLVSIFSFTLALGYVIFYVYILSIGINLYHGSWHKVYWPVPIMAAAVASFYWGKARESVLALGVLKKSVGKIVHWGGFLAINLAIAYSAWQYFLITQDRAIAKMEEANIVSSAFPGILSVELDNQLPIKEQLVPSFIDPDSKDYRLYIIDATVNIWWNALFDLPLARGYIDPPNYGAAGSIFWLNSALGPSAEGQSSSLVDDWEVPEEIAENNTHFLLDWYAIKYFEGNHDNSQTNSRLASDVISTDLIKETEQTEVSGTITYNADEWGVDAWFPEKTTYLNYYEVKDEIVSPILSATNATAIAVIGDEGAYDTISRFFGQLNLSSQKTVFIRGPQFIDDWKLSNYADFDAVILYGYDYHRHDKAWGLMDQYLEDGGKIFVETGGEVKESNTTNRPERFPEELPLLFPIRRTVREDLGVDWEPELTIEGSEEIIVSEFSPLNLNGESWHISHPPSLADLDEDAEVLLKNKGYPVVVYAKKAGGAVVWSGLNLPYHITRNHNVEEAEFLEMALSKLVSLKPGGPMPAQIDWISSEKRRVSGEQARGVLFKEQFYSGWTASYTGEKGDSKLTVYPAGPTDPGFMYVSLTEGGTYEVTFRYQGERIMWFYSAVSVIMIFFILDYVLLKQRVLGAGGKFVWNRVRKRFGKWWEREEEY